jgi:hypothetical protein
MLLLKILAKQGIIAESEAKPKSRNWTSRFRSLRRLMLEPPLYLSLGLFT